MRVLHFRGDLRSPGGQSRPGGDAGAVVGVPPVRDGCPLAEARVDSVRTAGAGVCSRSEDLTCGETPEGDIAGDVTSAAPPFGPPLPEKRVVIPPMTRTNAAMIPPTSTIRRRGACAASALSRRMATARISPLLSRCRPLTRAD
ncbi:hypothetical protein GCM10023196_093900 [Actinoallomurus vinaceus]|uniref:Uncharacterized protein n=1 Tax=Actinoallomurus vinaceus TaxID=1080074 RepID=A0ABP8UV36_9ACTN